MNIVSQLDKSLKEIEIILRYPRENDEVNRIRRVLNNMELRIVGKGEEGKMVIPAQAILYFEAVNRKVFIYTEQSVYESELHLYEISDRLRNSTFFQASRQIIINLNRVSTIRQEIGSRLLLTMDNGEKIVVSRQYAPEIRKEILKK